MKNMSEIGRKFEVKQMVPLALLGIAGVGLSFFCNPNDILELLRRQHQNTFGHLLNNSNEKDEVQELLASIPDENAQEVAKWLNKGTDARARAIKNGQVKKHLVMYAILRAASSYFARSDE